MPEKPKKFRRDTRTIHIVSTEKSRRIMAWPEAFIQIEQEYLSLLTRMGYVVTTSTSSEIFEERELTIL